MNNADKGKTGILLTLEEEEGELQKYAARKSKG
jgi:hypothetical protein